MRVNRGEPWGDETPREAFIGAHEAGERKRILRKIKDTNRTAAIEWIAEVVREGELAGQSVSVRAHKYAIRVVATLGPPGEVYSLLIETANDSEIPTAVRSKAVSQVIYADEDEFEADDRLWPALEAIITDSDVGVHTARRVFNFLRDENPARARNLATDILHDRQDGPDRLAVETLAELPALEDESLVETLEALVVDETVGNSTRNEALEALRKHAPDRAVALARSRLTDPDWDGRRDLSVELVETLAGDEDERSRDTLRSVITDTDQYRKVRSKAVDALADSGVSSDVEVILEVTRVTDEFSTSTLRFRSVATALAQFESETVQELFETVATDAELHRSDRKAAVEELPTVSPGRAVPALAEVLATTPDRTDQHYHLAEAALDALGQLATPPAVDVLASVLLSEQARSEHSSCGDGLDRVDVHQELVERVQHSELRRHAARELGEIGTERAVPALCAALTADGLGATERGARALADALASIGTERALTCLQTAIQAEITPATTYACARRLAEFRSAHIEAEFDKRGYNLVANNRPSTVTVDTDSLVAVLEQAYDHLATTRGKRATVPRQLEEVAADIGLLRADADLEAAIAAVGQYDGRGYPALLVEPALDRAVDTGDLTPVWELVEKSTCRRVMRRLMPGLVERVQQLGQSAVGELVLWLLDPGTGTPPYDIYLSPLHDEPTVILDHLSSERRDEFRSVVLARLRERSEGISLLAVFEVDTEIKQTVQTALGQMQTESSRQRSLETFEAIDADAAADVAASLLREDRLDWPAVNLLLDRDDDRVIEPLREYLDREHQPKTVGRLVAALWNSPADTDTVFAAIRETYRDPQFYRHLQDETGGYQTRLHDPRRSTNPKHLIARLYDLDQDRARTVLETDLHDCAVTELRLDIFSTVRTVLSESEWLACCRSLRDDQDPRVRYAALRPLARRQDAAAVQTLAQLVTEPGLTLTERKEAVAVIGAADTTDAPTHLIDIVESDHEYDVRGDADAVRWVAIRELAQLETPAADEYLARLQERTDGLGQAAAAATTQ